MYGNRVEGVEKPQFPAFMCCRAFAFLELRMPCRMYGADGSPAPCGMAYPIRKLGGRAWVHSAARQMTCRRGALGFLPAAGLNKAHRGFVVAASMVHSFRGPGKH